MNITKRVNINISIFSLRNWIAQILFFHALLSLSIRYMARIAVQCHSLTTFVFVYVLGIFLVLLYWACLQGDQENTRLWMWSRLQDLVPRWRAQFVNNVLGSDVESLLNQITRRWPRPWTARACLWQDGDKYMYELEKYMRQLRKYIQ